MRLVLFLAAFAATPALAQDEPRPPAYLNAEACLRENVGAAVGAASGAADAAEFLLSYLCAEPVEAAGRYQRNMASLTQMQGMMSAMGGVLKPIQIPEPGDDALDDQPPAEEAAPMAESEFSDMISGMSVDPVTGEFKQDPSQSALNGFMGGVMGAQMGAADQLFGDRLPTFLRTLAARLVMEQRRR